MIWDKFLNLADKLHRYLKREAGIMIGTETLVSIGISLAISALSYGISALLAPKPPKITGPRKDDLAGPIVAPGDAIPFASGRNMSKGKIIWHSGLVETKHTEKVKSGKGGSKKQKVESFTYSGSFSLAFNDGEVKCVHRIRANGSKIIWSDRFGQELTEAEIDAQVDAKYTEVFDADFAYWSGLTDAGGNPLYTTSQATQTADANATNESEKLRAELEANSQDFTERYDQIEFRFGTDDQAVSSIQESFLGSGNLSAYPGIAYVTFLNFEYADFGNAHPVLEVDYTSGSATSAADPTQEEEQDFTVQTGDANLSDTPDDDIYFVDHDRNKIFISVGSSGSTDPVVKYLELDGTTLAEVDTHDVSGNLTGGARFVGFDPETGYLFGCHGYSSGGFNVNAYVYDPATKTFVTDVNFPPADFEESPSDFDIQHMPVLKANNGPYKVVLSTDFSSDIPSLNRNNIHDFPSFAYRGRFEGPEEGVYVGTPSRPKWMTGSIGAKPLSDDAWILWASDDNIRFQRVEIRNNGSIQTEMFNDHHRTLFDPSRPFQRLSIDWTPYVSDDEDFIICSIGMDGSPDTYKVFRWNRNTDEIDWITDVDFMETQNQARVNTRLQGNFIVLYSDNFSHVNRIDLRTGTLVEDLEDFGFDLNLGSTSYDGVNDCLYSFTPGSPEDPIRIYCWEQDGGVCDTETTVAQVIEDYMQRAGYDATEYQIDSGLNQEVIYGFNDNAGRTSREILEDLARIRPVFAFESEGLIKFKLLTDQTVFTIPKEEVRTYEGKSKPPDWLNEVKTTEDLFLPKRLQITYRDHDRLLNPTPTIFTREITRSQKLEEFTVDAVDTAANMRRSVFNAFSQMLMARRSFKITVPQKYMVLEPGDVGTIPLSDTTSVSARVTKTERGANGVVELTLIPALGQELTNSTVVSEVGVDDFDELDPDTASTSTKSRLYVLDIPYLTDEAELNSDLNEDDGVYITVANDGVPSGANVFYDANKLQLVSDGGSPETFSQLSGTPEWELASSFTAFSDDGIYVRGLDMNANHEVRDDNSKFVVSFRNPNASFSNISDNAIHTSQENVFYIEGELLQAQTATLIGTSPGGLKTYEFTNLYRGLQGTEGQIGDSGGPGAGAAVVHLNSAAIERFDLENGDLVGLGVDFRVVTVGGDITAVDTQTHTYEANHRKPYAPEAFDVVRDGSGNITFKLLQRVRYGRDWDDAGSPQFTTDPDNFVVEIMDTTGSPDSVVRTLSVSGDPLPVFTYTAAQQITDFGSTQAAVDIRPYQLNDDGDRGFTNQETI